MDVWERDDGRWKMEDGEIEDYKICAQLDWMAKPIAPIATASFFGIALQAWNEC